MNWNANDLNKEWKRFKQHCQFTFGGPLSDKNEKAKVNYLMTYIGDKGREVYGTFQFAPAQQGQAAEQDTLAGVYAKFSEYVAPKTNQIRGTVTFNNRKQKENEKFDNFVTDLKILVKDCGYTEEDRMVRDCIVLRSFHEKVKEKCIDEGDTLTLAKAVDIGRNYETQLDSMNAIRGAEGNVNAVRDARQTRTRPRQTTGRHNQSNRNQNNRNPSYRNQSNSNQGNQRAKKQCSKCGYDRHDKQETCPAKDKTCDYCNGRNHFAKVCFKKKNKETTNQVEESSYENEENSEFSDYEDDGDMYLHPVYAVDENTGRQEMDDEWYEYVEVQRKKVRMQLDTGTKRCTLPYSVYLSLVKKPPLQKTTHRLMSYSGHQLDIKGKVTLPLKYKDNKCDATFYVVQTAGKPPLLSGETCSQLGLIERTYNVQLFQKEFPQLKKLTGTLPGTYTVKLDPTVKPVVHAPRRIPQALHEKVKKKLKEMEDLQQITKVTEPTDWVNSMMTVLKKDKVRICLDPKDLNRAVRREHYHIPTVEEVVDSLPQGSAIFSVFDAKSGFLQIKLDYESSLLTCFNSPLGGRYRYLRLPFGIKCAPEIFQRIMDNMLEGIDGARSVMDDILIAGKDLKDHDATMKQVIDKATEYNLKLNFDKCQIRQERVMYVGHLVTSEGLQPDPDKIKAVDEMPAPTDKEGIKRFLGFVGYLSKFIPNLSEVDAPLREVTKTGLLFHWDKPQQESFDKLKKLCTEHPVLAYYDHNKELTIQCDASSFALGGVLMQNGQPIAYTSRAMTETEQRYAQIEKEMLAIVHCCKKFHYYIFGRPVKVESDHKPLQSIYAKPLLSAPMRLQNMLLRLQAYDLDVKYKPGSDIPIGDALSRANLPDMEPDIEPITVNMVQFIAVSPSRYQDFQSRTANELNELHSMILKGWPDTRRETPHSIRDYYGFRDELAVSDGIVYKGMNIVVPPSLRQNMMAQVHESHQGITKCKQRARESLFWPGMCSEIEKMVEDCAKCQTYQNKQHKETMKPTPLPDLPWMEVASDIFDWEREQYLLTIDYYSRFIEVDKLPDLSSSTTIETLKSQFARHGIPEKLRSDNGPQYSSREFKDFCNDYQIEHATSSPLYPQSNGEAERAVQTVKRMWKKCKDKHLALLNYRTTPVIGLSFSPAQLLMSRRPRNKVPAARQILQPKTVDIKAVKQTNAKEKATQQKYYNRKAGQDLPVLKPGDPVRMSPLPGTKQWLPATVLEHHSTPRSYVVQYNGRKYRRNRRDLRISTYEANKVPRVASSSTAQHQQPAEAKSPVPVKSTSPPTRPSSQTATTSNQAQVQQHPRPEKATTPTSNKPATAPQKPVPEKAKPPSPSTPVRRNPPRHCGAPKKLDL